MDAERFTDIFSRLHAGMRRLAVRFVGDEDDAADIVQETFCRLWSRKDDVKDEGRIEGMMAVSVRNRCLTRLRDKSRYPTDRLGSEAGFDNSGMSGEGRVASVRDSAVAESPESSDEMGELYDEVEGLMRRHLSERDREILIMREQEEADFEEIAERFGMTPAAVRMALSRARKGVLKAYRDRRRSRDDVKN